MKTKTILFPMMIIINWRISRMIPVLNPKEFYCQENSWMSKP
jgi:hypothetical protein